MYAELFGIQNPSDIVENAAKWVQWAQAGIMAGATDNDATIRYNLNQFWSTKGATYATANLMDRSQLERLDTFAHGLWNALETAKIYSASPTYWNYFYHTLVGGFTDRPEAITAATNAAAAAAGQEQAAQRANQGAFTTGMTAYAQAQARNVAVDQQASAGMWKQPGINPLGIPLWAWIAGAVGLILVTKS